MALRGAPVGEDGETPDRGGEARHNREPHREAKVPLICEYETRHRKVQDGDDGQDPRPRRRAPSGNFTTRTKTIKEMSVKLFGNVLGTQGGGIWERNEKPDRPLRPWQRSARSCLSNRRFRIAIGLLDHKLRPPPRTLVWGLLSGYPYRLSRAERHLRQSLRSI
jgi:hypothetical protein